MYIDQWWGETVGTSDDSQVLLEYFRQGLASEYPLSKIFTDFNLYEQIQWGDLRETEEIYFTDERGNSHEIVYGIWLIIDLAAITLESLHSTTVSFADLGGSTLGNPIYFTIQPDSDELDCLLEILDEFAESPDEFDLADNFPASDLRELAHDCKEIAAEIRDCI